MELSLYHLHSFPFDSKPLTLLIHDSQIKWKILNNYSDYELKYSSYSMAKSDGL
jgi:hypothetical protein